MADNLAQRNFQRLQTAQANYLDSQAGVAEAAANDTWGFYLGFGTFEPAKHCVECLNGDVICGDKESMQTNGAVRENQKVMIHQVSGGQPVFYSMPR